MYYRALIAFHFIYFIVFSSTTFLPKYFGELGMTDGQIGMLMSLPAIAGVLFQPYFGSLTDRIRLKKYIVIVFLFLLTALCFAMDRFTGFSALMIGLIGFNILQLPLAPAYAAISLEYTRDIRRPYGPVRLMGTVGYQVGAVVVGIVLAASLQGLFRFIGVVTLLSGIAACFLPPVKGHQHGRAKVHMSSLLRDKHIVLIIVMVLFGTITSQFYISFFSKHLGDIGIGNTMTGVMLVVSVAMEIPFLIFADRISKWTSLWNWLLIGFALNAVRWLGFAFFRNVWVLMLFQIPGVSVMACFEFFPSIYLNKRADDALKGSAQTALMIISFGISKVIGSLLGGFISDRVGIPAVFGFNGIMLLLAIAVFWRPSRRMIAEEARGED